MSAGHPEYFVDESGDPVLFNRRGNVIVGNEGCSRYFIVGCLYVADSAGLNADMTALREELLADPTLNRVPSMTLERKKTALMFHAKDDIPEVRREVFKLLTRHDLKFSAVVRDKTALVNILFINKVLGNEYRYDENEVYDLFISELFTPVFSKTLGHRKILFSQRGNKNRTASLNAALAQAVRRAGDSSSFEVKSARSLDHGGLQAVDYFLWALQRLYELKEDRYWSVIWPLVELINDLDRRGHSEHGLYSQNRPLTLNSLEGRGI